MQHRVIGGRYALLAEIGRGAYGVVWRAQDQLIDRPVALKELHPPQNLPVDEQQVMQERMLREARAAGKLSDPAVVTVHDVISEDGRMFLAMEFVDAADLATIIERHGPMDAARVADIALRVLGALECAHAAGIVHRDVKPSNILVRPDGVVKLTDFGIAQAADDPRLTTHGGLIGSPAYMAPDRLTGLEATPASDLWALGATMAHAVEGVSPFERSSTASTLHAVMNERPTLTRATPALAEVIRGLLAPNPAQRLTAARARAMLTLIAHHAPAVLPRRRRNRGKIVAAALGVVVVAAGALLAHQVFLAKPESQAGAASATASTGGPRGEAVPVNGTATFGRGGDLPEWNLTGTECAQGFLTKGIPVLTGVPCDRPHSIQLFGAATPLWDKPKSEPYPGQRWLADFARGYCAEQFQRTASSGQQGLGFSVLVPTEWQAWDDRSAPGHQEVLCVAWREDRSPLPASVVG